MFSICLSSYVQAESVCYGTTSDGRLEKGEKMPLFAGNLNAYSTLGWTAGRTYVHSKVKDIILEAYKQLELTHPNKVFVYGESGWRSGGEFSPHKTHQNGLSIDLMVPVINSRTGESMPLPTSLFNKLGYGIEFNKKGFYKSYQIDFEIMGELIYNIHASALKHNVKIWRIIFDPDFVKYLHATTKGRYIKKNITIPMKPSWVRHDEHFHVDFVIPCKPL